eukprot:378571-Pelagomonas_calceolata.AAC.5
MMPMTLWDDPRSSEPAGSVCKKEREKISRHPKQRKKRKVYASPTDPEPAGSVCDEVWVSKAMIGNAVTEGVFLPGVLRKTWIKPAHGAFAVGVWEEHFKHRDPEQQSFHPQDTPTKHLANEFVKVKLKKEVHGSGMPLGRRDRKKEKKGLNKPGPAECVKDRCRGCHIALTAFKTIKYKLQSLTDVANAQESY